MLKKIILTLLFIFLLLIALAAGFLYSAVVLNPGAELDEHHIEQILGRESPVLYRDGHNKIGVFFNDAHRQYLHYEDMPKYFVSAIVAAEDNQFFQHFGIDIPGIIRAAIANFKAGRIVQGGSTLTQQTAENLFTPQARTYKAKLLELLYALRLEYHYSKEKILEFYANQFFVSGNGHGLGVAAHYYFNKEAADLTLVECAFIAGSVKRPNYYNPFTKKSAESIERAKLRARDRADYVLSNMLKQSMINQKEYLQAIKEEISFQPGKTTYALNTIMDLVKDGLTSPKIEQALAEHGIKNVSTSGIRIITGIEKELQEKTQTSLRRELSRLDVRIRGYDRDEVQKECSDLEYRGDKEPKVGAFLFGKITTLPIKGGKGDKKLQFRVRPDENIPEGIIDRQGLDRLLTALVKFNKNRWTKATDKHLNLLLGKLKKGDRVYVSIREFDSDGTPFFDLERFPKMEGAALVLQQGAIRAMVGGATNRFFNRAIDARRPMGSTFKPLLFTAAMQLGWNSTDTLLNQRNIFVFQNMPYFPRPDHISPHKKVSMSWAGVHSENIAAVWLLYHLSDHLSPFQLRELASKLDMAPRTDDDKPENSASFRHRIRDQFGIIVNRRNLERAAFYEAIKNLEADFLFSDQPTEYTHLKHLHYGLDFDKFREEIEEQLTDKKLKDKERKELLLRKKLLASNYLEIKQSLPAFSVYRKYISDQLADSWRPLFGTKPLPNLNPYPGSFFRDKEGRLLFSTSMQPAPDWYPVSTEALIKQLGELDSFEHQTFWDAVLIEGVASSFSLGLVEEQMKREIQKLSSHPPYSLDVLTSLPDFKIMLSLRYLLALSRELGVKSKLEPVLSFPLGANVISLLEGVQIYEAMTTGKRYEFDGELPDNDGAAEGLALIERIETPEGEIIYQQQAHAKSVIDTKITYAVGHILQNVVTYGTGRYAAEHVHLTSEDPQREKELEELALKVPIMGKTGTANRYTNAAFLGYIPALKKENDSNLSLDAGYSVGVYVGFDDNQVMKKNSTRITGAAGALPTWSDIANALYSLQKTGDQIDAVDLLFGGLSLQRDPVNQIFVRVDQQHGGRIPTEGVVLQTGSNQDAPAILTFGKINSRKSFEPARFYLPFWK